MKLGQNKHIALLLENYEGSALSNDTPALPGLYAENAKEYLDKGFYPIPVQGKFPPVSGATGHEGTVTPEKIAAWVADEKYADANIGLRVSGFIGIDVDDYNEKSGSTQLAELEQALGELPYTISSTSRGKDSVSRTYYYTIPEDGTFLSKAAPDIDVIQRNHRYTMVYPSWHPTTGAQYEWYDADGQPLETIPHAEDFEMLPESWLEFLTTDPAKQQEGFAGSIEEWLDSCEPGDPSRKVRAWMNNIPEDNFDHTDVVRITYALVRLGAEREPGIRQALETLFFTWVRPPYDGEQYKKELSVAIQGAIRKAGSFATKPDSLPEFFVASSFLPNPIPAKLNKLIFEGGELDELLSELFAYGLTDRDAGAIAWRSKASEPYRNDFTGFWNKLQDMQNAKKDEVVVVTEPKTYKLLTADERALVEEVNKSDMGNWMTRYLAFAKTKVPDGYLNEPYHRMLAWVAGSLVWGPSGMIAKESPMPLNMWAMIVGESSTGKSEAWKVWKEFLRAAFGSDMSFDIGSNASAPALQRNLIERDGMPSLFSDDEGHGPLGTFFNQKGFSDLPSRLTKWYDGEVTPMFRTVEKDLNGISAEAFLCLTLMSTPGEMFKVLSVDEFKSGFMARPVWAWGEGPKGEATYKAKFRTGKTLATGRDSFLDDWVAQIDAEREALKEHSQNGGIVWLVPTDEAYARAEKAGNKILNIFKNHKNEEMLDSPSKRMMDSMWKCAGILALSDGRGKIELQDILYVLGDMEMWLRDVERVSHQIQGSAHSRLAAELLEWMRKLKQSDVPREDIHNRLDRLEGFQIERLLDSLKKQGKLKMKEEGDRVFYRLVRDND